MNASGGNVYSFDFKAGKLRPVNAGEPIPFGQRVSYGDMANPRRVYVVVSPDPGPYGYRCVAADGDGESSVSRACLDGPGGWRMEQGRATVAEVEALLERWAESKELREAVRIVPPSREYLTPAQSAARIRAELKARGWSSRDISVRAKSYSMGSSIEVRIGRPGVRLAEVRAIAETQERIDRDAATGEILSGGNRYVHVELDSAAYKPVAAALLARIKSWPVRPYGTAFIAGMALEHHSERTTDAFRVYYEHEEWGMRGFDAYNAEAAADFIARRLFERFANAQAIADYAGKLPVPEVGK